MELSDAINRGDEHVAGTMAAFRRRIGEIEDLEF